MNPPLEDIAGMIIPNTEVKEAGLNDDDRFMEDPDDVIIELWNRMPSDNVQWDDWICNLCFNHGQLTNIIKYGSCKSYEYTCEIYEILLKYGVEYQKSTKRSDLAQALYAIRIL